MDDELIECNWCKRKVDAVYVICPVCVIAKGNGEMKAIRTYVERVKNCVAELNHENWPLAMIEVLAEMEKENAGTND